MTDSRKTRQIGVLSEIHQPDKVRLHNMGLARRTKQIKTTGSHSSDVIVFCVVAKTRSFSAAADQLGISRSLVSKRVARLEERLNSRLVQRSTRSMSLTEAGDLLYERYTEITDRIDRAEREVADLHQTHSGVVRFAAPMACSFVGVPLISKLHREYPNIEVHLSVQEDTSDIIRSGYDAAIHIGPLKDSNLICRKITTVRLVVCGAPKYLRHRGIPATPRDLKRHNCLTLSPEATSQKSWLFREADAQPFSAPVLGDFQTDSDVVLLRACLAGMGLAQLPEVLAGEYLESGELERVLDAQCYVSTDVFVVLPHRDMAEKVRVAVDYLTREVQSRFPAAVARPGLKVAHSATA